MTDANRARLAAHLHALATSIGDGTLAHIPTSIDVWQQIVEFRDLMALADHNEVSINLSKSFAALWVQPFGPDVKITIRYHVANPTDHQRRLIQRHNERLMGPGLAEDAYERQGVAEAAPAGRG
jgi:hypothetical protein